MASERVILGCQLPSQTPYSELVRESVNEVQIAGSQQLLLSILRQNEQGASVPLPPSNKSPKRTKPKPLNPREWHMSMWGLGLSFLLNLDGGGWRGSLTFADMEARISGLGLRAGCVPKPYDSA